MRDLTSLLTMSMTQGQKNLFDSTPTDPTGELDHAIQVVDLFAGPGGLGEGFTSFGDGRRFDIVVQPKRHHPLVKSSGYFIEIQN